MRGDEVGLDERARIGVVGQKMDMHLIGPEFGALVPEMGEIEARGIVPGLTEGKRTPGPVLVPAHQNVVGPGEGRASDQRVDAMQVAPSRGPAPIMKCLSEGSLCADESGLIRRPPLRLLNFDFARPHGIPAR